MIQPRYSAYVSKHRLTLTVILGGVAVLALWSLLLGASATSTAMRVAENDQQTAQYYMTSAQSLYAAEAGVEEARARLRTYAGLYHIVDTAPDASTWGIFIGTPGEVQEPGYEHKKYARVPSLQHDLTYNVAIRHATHPTDTAVLRWGDARGEGVNTRNTTHGENIYVITAHGMQGEARHTVEIEAAPEPSPTVPAALYVAGPLRMQGSRTNILGNDSCGDQHQAGVRTTLPPPASLHQLETALPVPPFRVAGTPSMVYQSAPLHVQTMLDTLKERATVVYAPPPAAEDNGTPAVHWGSPRLAATPQTPSTCNEGHIVYYDTHGAPGRLPQGTSGCGVLLVEGDAEIQGDFHWYGAILVTGSLSMTGGGSKQITGGIVVAGTVTIEGSGETNLVYCSTAIAQQTRSLPLRILSWRDVLLTTH